MSIGNLVCYPTQRIMILSNSQGLKLNYPFISFISFGVLVELVGEESVFTSVVNIDTNF